MRCILSQSYNPYFNLAAEEYLLKEYSGDVFMLWISNPAVIVGKHQNTLAEINFRHILENNIIVARRLSGGGTVYHDKGNINFTFIASGQSGKLIDFRRYTEPVIDFLRLNGINACLGEKNEILANGFKISGNAEHIYKNRVLHHGTLLFNTNLEYLRSSLAVAPGRYESKAVKSNPADVKNIADFLQVNVSVNEFLSWLMNYMMSHYHGGHNYFSAEEVKKIELLSSEKYSSWDWIYGYSPDYRFANTFIWNGFNVNVELTCKKGIITTIIIKNAAHDDFSEIITDALTGCRHYYSDMLHALEKCGLSVSYSHESLHWLVLNLI